MAEYRHSRLPNLWVLLLAASGLAFNTLAGEAQGMHGAMQGLIGALAGGLIAGAFLFLPFMVRAADGGDVKMLAAAGCVTGLPGVMTLLVQVSIFGILYALVEMIRGRVSAARLRHIARSLFDWRYDRKAGAASLPPRTEEACRVKFGIPIAAGFYMTLFLLLWGPS